MKIHFRELNIQMTDVLRARLQRRLGLALGRFGARIDKVIVRLQEGEVPGGNRETRCQIDVRLLSRTVTARDADADPAAAVNGAADRVSRSIARVLEREAS